MQHSESISQARPTWFRGVIQGKTRILMAWVFAIILGLSARSYPVWPGVALCWIGATLRFWASGYLRKDTRPAVGGPYAFVRNPLYLGTYLMALGTAWAAQSWILLGVGTGLFALVYHYIILDEEIKLQRLFGQPYTEYCRLVPRFFPRVWLPFAPAPRAQLLQVNPEQEHLQFSWDLAKRNRAFEAYWSFLGLVGWVTIMALLWQ
jgi:protein-S-isoprenylcysteine O-methyltransferase Ste14